MIQKKLYSTWFIVPVMVVFTIFFLVPMATSLFFSLTVWDFNSVKFCGVDNFKGNTAQQHKKNALPAGNSEQRRIDSLLLARAS